jgi:hypothetical protein
LNEYTFSKICPPVDQKRPADDQKVDQKRTRNAKKGAEIGAPHRQQVWQVSGAGNGVCARVGCRSSDVGQDDPDRKSAGPADGSAGACAFA